MNLNSVISYANWRNPELLNWLFTIVYFELQFIHQFINSFKIMKQQHLTRTRLKQPY
uniref:Uncharacterized protein n=1 Tax=Arundo donax TaxID=35708 RepID=A0A0A8Z5Z3_ARUDO